MPHPLSLLLSMLLCQNSIRHNLSLHDMFIRETTQDGKISYWTIRPEANRCLTLDQVYKVGMLPTFLFCHILSLANYNYGTPQKDKCLQITVFTLKSTF